MSQKIILGLMCLVFSLINILGYTTLAATNITNENLIDELTSGSSKSTTRGYNLSDKDKISFVSLNGTTLVLSAPLAQKDGKAVSNYYISRGPVSYKEIMSTSNGIEKLHDSKEYKSMNNKEMYEIKDNKLFITLIVDDVAADLYVTIAPETDTEQGTTIEDYKINPASQAGSATKVLAENFSNSTLNKAISDVSCIWTKDQNRVNLTWSVNTALNAKKVEIYHRPDENQGTMDLKGTVTITDKTFTMNTPHRNIQLFRFKPVDNNGTMVGEEIQYICKPDVVQTTPTMEDKPNDTTPIPVTPHTGPKETLAFILFISALAYAVYRKTRAA